MTEQMCQVVSSFQPNIPKEVAEELRFIRFIASFGMKASANDDFETLGMSNLDTSAPPELDPWYRQRCEKTKNRKEGKDAVGALEGGVLICHFWWGYWREVFI